METEIYTEEWNEIEWNRYIRIKINGMDSINNFLENYFIFGCLITTLKMSLRMFSYILYCNFFFFYNSKYVYYVNQRNQFPSQKKKKKTYVININKKLRINLLFILKF